MTQTTLNPPYPPNWQGPTEELPQISLKKASSSLSNGLSANQWANTRVEYHGPQNPQRMAPEGMSEDAIFAEFKAEQRRNEELEEDLKAAHSLGSLAKWFCYIMAGIWFAGQIIDHIQTLF